MATIGTFQQSGNDFSGENAPSHRVFVGQIEIGAAWSKQSNEGRNYLGLKLDDPSFTARSTPIWSKTKMAGASASSGRGRTAGLATERSGFDAPYWGHHETSHRGSKQQLDEWLLI